MRNPPHPAGNRRANRRNLLNLDTDLLYVSSLDVKSIRSSVSRCNVGVIDQELIAVLKVYAVGGGVRERAEFTCSTI